MLVKQIFQRSMLISLMFSANFVNADVVEDPNFDGKTLSMPNVSAGDKVYSDVKLELDFDSGQFKIAQIGEATDRLQSVMVGADEKVVDSIAKLSWVNGTHACHINANAAATATMDIVEYCNDLEFAGESDWRAPTSAEISNMIIQADRLDVKLNYINPSCQFMAASDGFVKTENTSNPGEIVESAVNSGSRCVREN